MLKATRHTFKHVFEKEQNRMRACVCVCEENERNKKSSDINTFIEAGNVFG